MAELDDWIAALADRHQTQFRRTEFLKAIRALSARYVERRAALAERSPLDSAGKRAAFASFYAPLHALTVAAIVGELRPAAVGRIIDLGCGTGGAGIGWWTSSRVGPAVDGVDRNGWALDEARWNYRQLGVDGHVRRGDLVVQAERSIARREGPEQIGIVAGWSVNELEAPDRALLLDALLETGRRGANVLVVEPLARSASPWWDGWADRWKACGGRADEWRCAVRLPSALADLDRTAGFQRDHLTARTLFLGRCI
jgi:hypothetical protein